MDVLLEYAHHISRTTSAPPGYVDGAPQLKAHVPPCPQPPQWEASLLYPRNLKMYKDLLAQEKAAQEQEKKIAQLTEAPQTSFPSFAFPFQTMLTSTTSQALDAQQNGAEKKQHYDEDKIELFVMDDD